MAVKRGGGALAALALAGLAYLWKNRKQVSETMKDVGDTVQDRLNLPSHESSSQTETQAYLGETKRI